MKEVLGPCITRPGPHDFSWFGIKSQMEGPVEMVWEPAELVMWDA